VQDALAGSGQPLDAAARAFFEPRFGRDFSQVRVHADAPAAASANDVGARAYAVDHHIAFASGQYQPATKAGRKLLAHELAHVEQQTDRLARAANPLLQRQADQGGGGGASGVGLDPDDQGQEGGSQGASPPEGYVGGGGQSGGGGASGNYGDPDGETGSPGGGGGPQADTDQGDGSQYQGGGKGNGTGAQGDDDDGTGGGISITFPDVELFDPLTKCGSWSASSGEVPIYTARFNIPKVGPIDAMLYVRGKADANICANLGPGMLQNIRVILDPLGGTYSGTAELAIPATLSGGLTLSGTSGAHADYAGLIEVVRGEGTLAGQGAAIGSTTYIFHVDVKYSGGSFSFNVADALTNCLALRLNAVASNDVYVLGSKTPCFSGKWNVADWSMGECWNVGARLGYGAGGLDYEIEGSAAVLAHIFSASISSATFTGGLLSCVIPSMTPAPPGIVATPSVTPMAGPCPALPPGEQVRLELPGPKASPTNIALYRGFVTAGKLQHRIGRGRDTRQRRKWDSMMRKGEMQRAVWDQGKQMDLCDRAILRPQWTKGQLWKDTQVDHVIEHQVATIHNETQFDEPWNFELLDQASNGSAGPSLDAAIARERSRLVSVTGDANWATCDLTFTILVPNSPTPTGRWSKDEVGDGLHLREFKRLGLVPADVC
jgi:hypothetical protein